MLCMKKDREMATHSNITGGKQLGDITQLNTHSMGNKPEDVDVLRHN